MHRSLRLLPVLFLLPTLSWAYTAEGNRWPGGETLFHVGLAGSSPSGMRWSDAFADAMAEWSQLSDFRFHLDRGYRDPCAGYSSSSSGEGFPMGSGDGYNGVDFGDSMCGNDLGRGVVAVTLIRSRSDSRGGHIMQTDIIFNSAHDWDVYSGRLRRQQDFRRTALHELGHALGLGHEEEQLAIMYPRVSNVDTLQFDDIAGANALYGTASSLKPRLANARNLAGLGSSAEFSGGVSADRGRSWGTRFRANDSLSVSADILPATEHVGQQANFYILAMLGDGSRYARHADGQFRPYTGGLEDLPAWRQGRLDSRVGLQVIEGFVPANDGLRQTRIDVYVGYAPAGSNELIYNGQPISFEVGS